MPTIRENTMDDTLRALPEWTQLPDHMDGDVFVAAVGFEDRSPVCFKRWCEQPGAEGRTAILIQYPFNKADNEKQAKLFREAAATAGVAIEPAHYAAASLYGELKALLTKLSRSAKIRWGFHPDLPITQVDISRAAREVPHAYASLSCPREPMAARSP